MKREKVIVLLIFFLAGTIANGQKIITLPEAIDIAIKNSIEVGQRSLQSEAARITYNQSRLNLLPNVNGNVTHGINQGRSIDPFTNSYVNQRINYASYGLGGDVILFNGFSLQNAIKQNAFAFDAAKMDVQQSKDNLTLAVILAYLQVLSNEDQVILSEKQVSVTQIQVDRLEKLNREGAISPPLLYDLRGQLKDAELNRISAKNAVMSSKLTLTQLMLVPFDSSLVLQKVEEGEWLQKPAASVEEVFKNAQEELAVIKAARFRRQSAEAGVRYFRGILYPTIALSGNLNTNYSSAATQEIFRDITESPSSNYVMVNGTKVPVIVARQNFNSEKISYTNQLRNNVFSNISLSLRLPIFNSFAARNRVRLATLELKSATLALKGQEVQVRQEVERAFVNMNNGMERYKILLEQVAAYAESFRAAEVRFNAGVGSTVEYTLAKEKLDRAGINLVTAKYEYLLRRKIFEFYSQR